MNRSGFDHDHTEVERDFSSSTGGRVGGGVGGKGRGGGKGEFLIFGFRGASQSSGETKFERRKVHLLSSSELHTHNSGRSEFSTYHNKRCNLKIENSIFSFFCLHLLFWFSFLFFPPSSPFFL